MDSVLVSAIQTAPFLCIQGHSVADICMPVAGVLFASACHSGLSDIATDLGAGQIKVFRLFSRRLYSCVPAQEHAGMAFIARTVRSGVA